jgi:2-keto-3-deoxy-6-phosphogluconate aldolase
MGSKLIRKDLVAAGDWAGITAKVRQVLAWIQEVQDE